MRIRTSSGMVDQPHTPETTPELCIEGCLVLAIETPGNPAYTSPALRIAIVNSFVLWRTP
jgi:hypothetical protein